MAIALIVTIVFVALVVYGLERNDRRQRQAGPRSPLSGSPNATEPDRDLERVRDELTAISGRYRSD